LIDLAAKITQNFKELAVPRDVYQSFLRFEPAKTVIDRYQVRLIIYDVTDEVIEQWIE